ncbi:MAG TPA: efflux RND transporter periplasmic adaptor subunit [Candidatus Lustribacter sp.]|jgi:HlyD family secretion protein|nr:efflux RND transporter periplasmic adaptor subunit [Candidatus Lustribacter sp.]
MTTTVVAPPPSSNGAAHAVTRVPAWKRIPRRALLVGALIAVLVIAAIVTWRMLSTAPVVLVTTPVQLGTLVRTVTASGTVNPQNTISIGSQISGTISEVDVDYNSVVKLGQVLARIDPTNFQTALDQAQAQLAETQANARQAAASAVGANAGIAVQSATATAASDAIAGDAANVVKAQGALVLAQQTIARDQSLLKQGFVAQNAVDADQSSLESAASGVTSAQATLTQARSQYVASAAQNTVAGAQAQASAGTAQAGSDAIGIQAAEVKTAQYNLAHTTISSPVNGTVISRNVAIGETVASSFSTPVLFTIAQDLSKMEVDLAVGEPDIGSVKSGAAVTFTVLAYPTTFSGIVSQVRQNPTVVSNVVTYDTVVIVNNKNGLLRPGMTANALIQTQSVTNALIVPLQALEYRPSAGVIAKYHLGKSTGNAPAHPHGAAGTVGAATGSKFGATMGAGATALAPGSRGRVFVLRSGAVVSVPVYIVLTAATQAAVKPVTGTLTADDAVVTADTTGAPAHAAATTQSAPGFGQSSQGGGAARAVH